MKYSVGDKVRVRSDLIIGKDYGALTWLGGSMSILGGRVLTIEKVYKGDCYSFEETVYSLSEEMIECKVAFKIKCTIANDDDFEVGKEYYINDKGFFTDRERVGRENFKNFDDWYDKCHWTKYSFKLVEDYTKTNKSEVEEECEMKKFKYKVGDCVKFERDEFKSIGKIVEIRVGRFNDEYLIELPKESHGDGHNGNGFAKGNYKEDNYWFIDDSDIECKVDGSEFESTKEEIKVAKFKVGDRIRANVKSNDKYSITNLRNKYEGVVEYVYEGEKFKTEDGYILDPEYFDLIEEPKHKTEFIEPANEDIKVKDQFLYDHKVKTNGDIVFNKVKMLTLCFVKYNHWGKVYTFINPTGKVLKEGTKVLVDSAGRDNVAYVVSSVKVQAKHVDGLVYAMTGEKHLELKNVLGVYEVKTKVKEFEVLKKF